MTDSGYPNRVRMWKRGTPLEDAPVVFEGSTTDVLTYSKRYHDRGVWHEMRTRAVTFYRRQYWWERGGEWKKLDIPEDMEVSTFKDTFLLTLRSEWAVAGRVFKQGALLSVGLDAFFAGELSTITVLFEPSESESLQSQCGTLNFLGGPRILGLLSDVKTKLKVWEYRAGSWHHRGDQTGYGMESIDLRAVDEDHSDELWATVSGYIRPSSLYLASIESLLEGKLLDGLPLKALPHFFEAGDLEVQQHFTPSKDGTKIPYPAICKKGMKLDGSNKTLLYGYGGFEISLTPAYGGGRGAAWLEQGGVWVDANIRGGSEYGPQWHQCAKKSNRRKCYEDFEAVAEDLIARGVTCRQGLACRGGSNGGLLIGNMLTRRSWELFGALVCEVPLLDMRKFHKLLAGASWMGEYGDPDKDWDDFLHEYSPYHNVSDAATYPPIFFVTSTKDDRVHPGHARKMVARMLTHPTGAATTTYYENIEGGHGGAADNKQRAYMDTLKYKFCWKKLSGAQTPRMWGAFAECEVARCSEAIKAYSALWEASHQRGACSAALPGLAAGECRNRFRARHLIPMKLELPPVKCALWGGVRRGAAARAEEASQVDVPIGAFATTAVWQYLGGAPSWIARVGYVESLGPDAGTYAAMVTQALEVVEELALHVYLTLVFLAAQAPTLPIEAVVPLLASCGWLSIGGPSARARAVPVGARPRRQTGFGAIFRPETGRPSVAAGGLLDVLPLQRGAGPGYSVAADRRFVVGGQRARGHKGHPGREREDGSGAGRASEASPAGALRWRRLVRCLLVVSEPALRELLDQQACGGRAPRRAGGAEWSLQSLVTPDQDLRIEVHYTRTAQDSEVKVVGRSFKAKYPGRGERAGQGAGLQLSGPSPADEQLPRVPEAVATQVRAKNEKIIEYMQEFHSCTVGSLVTEFLVDASGKAILHAFLRASPGSAEDLHRPPRGVFARDSRHALTAPDRSTLGDTGFDISSLTATFDISGIERDLNDVPIVEDDGEGEDFERDVELARAAAGQQPRPCPGVALVGQPSGLPEIFALPRM
ncbi:unnamed protein product [Prorocentrum cordatum]|uniref:Peptidase S9 prolyl oligopeptidase catalytic domain-containing protein n=1 Tax=Prorocentrum cordatum TaxID=2364126 RepID=A0ABN9R672_9DINO|nr:unnamed protein product [Polarella glacialis]